VCAVIGCYLENPTAEQIETLKTLFLQSQIRGKHATGYSILKGNKVVTKKKPLPAEEFLPDFFEVDPGDYTLQLIGHCRYSTSDLRFNQPMQLYGDSSLVHNGVVDQRNPDHWAEYGYELQTSNDSELLYQAAHAGKEPLQEFPEASIAACELSTKKGLRWYRNGKRPLYHGKVSNGYFICSTADIAKRANLKGVTRCEPGMVYSPQGSEKLLNIEELVP
jgi:glutamine phosphoribosylpyrophosphate amidotransferase